MYVFCYSFFGVEKVIILLLFVIVRNFFRLNILGEMMKVFVIGFYGLLDISYNFDYDNYFVRI